jgi:hypothetical protein
MPKARKPAAPATVQAPATPATVQAPTLAPVPATTVQVPAVYAGLPFENLTRSQQAFATAKRPVALAPALATGPALTINPGKPYRVASANNAHWWSAITGTLANAGGQAPATAMVAAGACPKFVGYAVQRGWLIPA